MKNTVRSFFLALALAPLASSATPTVSYTQTGVSGASFDVLSPPSVTVSATGADWVRAEIWQGDTPNGEHGAVHRYLSQSGSSWTGTFPTNHAGSVTFRFVAGDDSTGETSKTATYTCTYTENYESSDAMGPYRRPVWGAAGDWYSKWHSSETGNNTVQGWTRTNARMDDTYFVQLDGLNTNDLDSASSTNKMRKLVMSTGNTNPVGSVWFKARLGGAATNEASTLVVSRVSRVGSGIAAKDFHEDLQTFSISRVADSEGGETNAWQQFHIVVQDATVTRIGFRNATSTGGPSSSQSSDGLKVAIDISDIVIAPPQADVKICRFDEDYEPGFPSVRDPVTFRCAVSNIYDAATADCITPKLVWRQSGGWNVSPMTNTLGRTEQGDGTYAITLTQADGIAQGPFEYFFRTDFAGYTPHFEAVNTNLVYSETLRNNFKGLKYNNEADLVSFNIDSSVPDSVRFVVPRIDASGNSHDLDTTAYSVLSRSPAYSWDLDDWRTTIGTKDSNVAKFCVRNESSPALSRWELSHRFDVENLDGVWLKSLGDAALEVEFEDAFPYSSLLASEGIRRFRSLYNDMALAVEDHQDAEVASHLDSAYPMQQVDDYTWQAIIRLTNEIDIAVCVTSDWSYSESDGALKKGPYEWGEIDQEETAINPPMSGTLTRLGAAESASGWDAVRAQMNYQGFMMFRFCTTNGAYQIRRAAWQDFNAWQADDEIFSRSYGLYGATRWENDAENVEPSYDGAGEDFVGIEGESPSSSKLSQTYSDGILANNVWFTRERVRATGENATTNNAKANMAWRLSTARDTIGSMQTTSESSNDGLGRGTFSFRARAITADDRAIYYTGLSDAKNWSNKRFVGHFSASAMATNYMSSGYPSFSVYGYWQDPDNYWEARLTQVMTFRNQNPYDYNGLALEIFKRENGVLTRIGGITNSNNGAVLSGRNGGFVLDFNLKFDGTTVSPSAYVRNGSTFVSSGNAQPAILNLGGNLTLSNASFRVSNTSVTNGTIGFNMRDCETTVSPYVYEADQPAIYNGYSGTYPDNYKVTTASPSDWTSAAYDSYALYRSVSPWTIDSTKRPTTLTRSAHDASFRIKVVRSNMEDAGSWVADLSENGWEEDWDEVNSHTNDCIYTVSNYGWTHFSIPMMLWDDSFIMIETVSTNASGAVSTADLLVDDLDCTNWRGETIYEPETGETAIDDYEAWKATYAVVTEESLGGGVNNREYELDLSRRNPNAYMIPGDASSGSVEDQAIVTPLMENGVGDIIFSYRVERAPVQFVVEYVMQDGGVQPLRDVTVEPTSEWARMYVPVLSTEGGRIQIRTEELTDSTTGEKLYGNLIIDNLAATDYPNDDSTSWEGYNLLVSTFRTNSSLRVSLSAAEALALKFDRYETPTDEYRSAVLNDYPNANTGDLQLFDHQPYVQTPSIATGIGEVSFWYRRSPDCTNAPVSLRLMAATAASPLDEDWTELTADAISTKNPHYAEYSAALDGLSAIENDDWVHFTVEFYSKDYKVLRLMGETNGANRVMLDNILITEPVRASINIGSIVFDPDIPLSTDSVGVKVKLANPKMNPKNMSVSFKYFARDGIAMKENGDDSLWGYSKWKDYSQAGTIEFTNTVSEVDGELHTNAYEFVSVDRIPRLAVDNLVQYCAIVEYDSEDGERYAIDSETQERSNDNDYIFENPSWYEPTDMNEIFGTTNNPVSHYWVFSCTTNVVWINEVKFPTTAEKTNARRDEYMTQQFVELIGPESRDIGGWTLEYFGRDVDTEAMWTNNVTSGAKFQTPNNASEGNPKGWGFWVLGNSGVSAANQALFPQEIETSLFLQYPGAIRLRRSMGADVDKICYGDASSVAEAVEQGYTRIGATTTRERGLSLVGRVEDDGEGGEIGYLDWQISQSSALTAGGYNLNEENVMSAVDAVEEEDDSPVPYFEKPVFTDIYFQDSKVYLTFSVTVTNGVSLTSSSGWTWEIGQNDDVDPGSSYWTWTTIRGVEVPVDDGESQGTQSFTVPVDELEGASFYRIRATRQDDGN